MQLYHETQRRGQLERRYALIAGAVLAAGFCAGIWALAAGTSPFDLVSLRSAAVDNENRTGTVLHAASGRCRSFDNDTGRTAAADGACERREEQVHGTAGRMDAIRKSAFGK